MQTSPSFALVRLVIALVAALAGLVGLAGCKVGNLADCGERPELPYTCANGDPVCTCENRDGVPTWSCAPCDEIDCAADPTSKVCKEDASCIGCHGLKSGPDSVGIENSHPWSYIGCTSCHGGVGVDPSDPEKRLTIAEAHVPMPTEMASPGDPTTPREGNYENHYLGRAGVENMVGGLDWIRFMNPGDLRITDVTCAQSGCHEGMTEKVKRSVMSTLTGKYDAMLQLAGSPRANVKTFGDASRHKHLATYGAVAVTDVGFDPVTAPPGAVPELAALISHDREAARPFGVFNEQDVLVETVNKLCGDCHLNNNGSNNKYGTFRSSGCSACHMPYDYSGRSASSDPALPKDEPSYPAAYSQITFPERPHPRTHQLKRVMSSQDCLACHTGSNRTVLQYMGIRTDDNRDLTRARAAGKNINFRYSNLIDNKLNPQARLHGFAQDQLIEYEDLDNNGLDDTPPDVHYEAGLECIDCHTANEMHGDGRIYSRQDQATEIRCVSCHGNLEYAAAPDDPSNPVNQLFFATSKPERKYLWNFDRVPAYGETGYPFVTQPGVWLRTKTTGAWKYVTQIKWGVMWNPGTGDCIEEGRRIDPRTNTFVCAASSSINHGRWDGLSASQGDFRNGVGPRPNDEVLVGADGQSSTVREGFSHLGKPATGPNQNHVAGLECSACHAAWHNMRYGNHLGLTDMKDGQRIYDWDRITGQTTLGAQAFFDFSYVDNLTLQLGVNAKGKIAYFIPTRLKMFVRSQVLDPAKQLLVDFMKLIGDPSFAWKTYRDRTGYGNLMYEAGPAQKAPGYSQICLEPFGFCDTDPRKNLNGALGVDQMEPHSIRREARTCTSCHMNATAGNSALVSAVYGWNPQGFTRATSAYLAAIDNVQTPHGSYSTADGFMIADDGIRHKLDWLVDEATGYPLASTLHVRTDNGTGYDTYDRDTAGPITKALIELLKRVRVR